MLHETSTDGWDRFRFERGTPRTEIPPPALLVNPTTPYQRPPRGTAQHKNFEGRALDNTGSLAGGVDSTLTNGHARAVATRAAERLRDMIVEVNAIYYEVRQAITPAEDRAAAA